MRLRTRLVALESRRTPPPDHEADAALFWKDVLQLATWLAERGETEPHDSMSAAARVAAAIARGDAVAANAELRAFLAANRGLPGLSEAELPDEIRSGLEDTITKGTTNDHR